MAGAFDDFDPTGAKQQGQPVATPQPKQATGGAFSDFNPTGAAPPNQGTAAAHHPPPAGQPSQGWGIDWSKGGEVTMPQSVQDWGTVAGLEAGMGLPGLRAPAAAGG